MASRLLSAPSGVLPTEKCATFGAEMGRGKRLPLNAGAPREAPPDPVHRPGLLRGAPGRALPPPCIDGGGGTSGGGGIGRGRPESWTGEVANTTAHPARRVGEDAGGGSLSRGFTKELRKHHPI